MEKISILIVDDHQPFRAGLRALFEATEDINVIGEAETGAQAIMQAARLQPDVVLMDLQMPDVTGIDATRRILHTSPHISILVLTMFEDDDFVFAALRAGARGYLLKGASKAEILRAVRVVCNGEAIFGATIAKRLMTYFSSIQRLDVVPEYAFPELTDREREILNLIVENQPNADIAKHLGISLKTVRNHVSNIFNKLQVVDRTQAILKAHEVRSGGSNLDSKVE
jgi:DNA-binding NarL/FixJ family response regulator